MDRYWSPEFGGAGAPPPNTLWPGRGPDHRHGRAMAGSPSRSSIFCQRPQHLGGTRAGYDCTESNWICIISSLLVCRGSQDGPLVMANPYPRLHENMWQSGVKGEADHSMPAPPPSIDCLLPCFRYSVLVSGQETVNVQLAVVERNHGCSANLQLVDIGGLGGAGRQNPYLGNNAYNDCCPVGSW